MSTARVQEYLASIPAVTKILLVFNIVLHIVIFVTSLPIAYVAINPILIIVRGEYYRLVSSAFVHGGLLHIGMNMSTLLAIGGALESQYGSLTMLFLTSWALVLTGSTFVLLVWSYSNLAGDPGALNTSAVGYSGVLFAYALIEAFHSAESSRSVFGLFSVPTKAYPFILLVLIQVLMPNISWWGHLSGLLVGVLLISRPGVATFMPSTECLQSIEQSALWRSALQMGGYVPVRDKALVHSALEWGAGAGLCTSVLIVASWCWTSALYVLWLLWQAVVAALHVLGVPASATQCVEPGCALVGGGIHAAAQGAWRSVGGCGTRAWACIAACSSGASAESDLESGTTTESQGSGSWGLRTVYHGLSGYAPIQQEEPAAPPPALSPAPAPAVHYV